MLPESVTIAHKVKKMSDMKEELLNGWDKRNKQLEDSLDLSVSCGCHMGVMWVRCGCLLGFMRVSHGYHMVVTLVDITGIAEWMGQKE